MKKSLLTALLALGSAAPAAFGQTAPFGPIGFVTQTTGITGGAGGTSVTVSTGTALMAAIVANKSNAPLTIYINGVITPANTPTTYDKIEIKDRNNISIIGVGSSGEFNGIGLYVRRASNIIIQNIKVHHVQLGPKDCIGIEGPANHIWVDHCELYNVYQGVGVDDYDGLLDIKDDAEYVTFSWNYLHDAWKASLSGYTETDTYNRKVTYHHNRFENINSRLPLFRGGTGHVFNNYYKDIASTAVNSRVGACVKIENNYFLNTKNPYVSAYSSVVGYGDISGNTLVNSPFQYSSDTYQLGACTLPIPYPYASVLNTAAEVPAVVLAGAGVGKLGTVTGVTKPVAEQLEVFPNPFKGQGTFAVNLPGPSRVGITLYTLEGRKVAEVATPDKVLSAGAHRFDYRNAGLTPGLYFYVVSTEQGSYSQKLVVQ
ncbi:pectate lyase family protein [Hymenobacter cellulosilyticus]|uniref:T9SS type A sorting domain-containing protein n=1 Tax=Hymenobacter cellulosilyticus TaxID=2932248 RepID=A0A8T9QDY9_9BACT|nr:T9SS type A sorting domain-containing protein [Hymenobacter cellulosilyticus]UOQ74040.1 T9SS type A sorting domain-containing protein [Hymenobacter cellulosilyticus]